jgi:hypothetical protein
MARIHPALIAFAVVVILTGIFVSLPSSKNTTNAPNQLTGFVVHGKGCCIRYCEEVAEEDCLPGEYFDGKACGDLEQCNVGCCIDEDYYCYTNYLRGNCDRKGSTFIRRMCNELWDCITPHDSTPYACYAGFGLVNPTQFGCRQITLANSFIRVLPPTGKSGTVFSIGVFVNEYKNVDSVRIHLKDQNDVDYGVVQLFDDSSHNDGAPGDGYFANVWDSSDVPEGMHYMTVIADIYRRGTVEPDKGEYPSIFTVVGGSDCIPMAQDEGVNHDDTMDVVFLRRNTNIGSSAFAGYAGTAALALNSVAVAKNLLQTYFYTLDKNIPSTVGEIDDFVKNECPLTPDKIIILDPFEPACEMQGDIIVINPEFTFGDVASLKTTVFDGNFCDLVKTRNTIMLDEVAKNTPPVFKFGAARDSPLPDSYEIPYMVSDNRDKNLTVSFTFNNVPLKELTQVVKINTNLTVRLPCLPGDQVSVLRGESLDSDRNYGFETITIEIPAGKGYNEENCPQGTPRNVWHANQNEQSSIPTLGGEFDPDRFSGCEYTLDEDPLCCYNRGTWTEHVTNASRTWYSCDNVECGEGKPQCPANRYCANGLCVK